MFDAATAGLQNAVGDGRTAAFRLLGCTPNCKEGKSDRDKTPGGNTGDWPRYTRFVFTADPEDGPTWHSIYRAYFMADAFAPMGVHSAGHCGNCHVANMRYSEEGLYEHLFDNPFFFPTLNQCGVVAVDMAEWRNPLLQMFAGLWVDPRSSLVNPRKTAVTWMTEPAGGFPPADEGNMPFDVFCPNEDDVAINSNDMAKSRIKRWILANTP
jgi:hypothetical protein